MAAKKIAILIVLGVFAAMIFGLPWWRPVNPCVIGDMSARAQARVPIALKEIYFDAQNMRVGLGSAAVGGWEGLGDAVAVDGSVWIRNTNNRSPKYYATVSNRYFQSNGFIFVPPGFESEQRWRVSSPTSLAQLRETLAKKNSAGVIFAGYVRLVPLRLIAIAHPAIDGRPVSKNAPYYYTRPMQSAPEAWAYVVGLAAANASVTRTNHDWMSSLLDVIPFRRDSGFGLVHGLWLKSAPDNLHSPPRPDNVLAVGQLMAETMLVEGELALYPVTRAATCEATARAP
jgi:hypothetical protein